MTETIEGNKLIAEFMGYGYFEANVHDDGGGRMDNVYSKVPIEIEEYDECKFFKSLPNPDFKKQKPEKWNPEFGLLSWQTLNHDQFIYGVLEYHTSWDWLMPVWSKAGQLSQQLAMDEEKATRHNRMCDKFEEACFQNKPELAQELIVDFLTWYNQNKTS